ncbi:bryoporin-like [Sparus aurata]|uniref:bryoporin-like n=1 Tax=Sparus aurata TaxID=8175 RepID=UPI0011C0C9CF|nr:bryoporin-like [Sparus aurata]
MGQKVSVRCCPIQCFTCCTEEAVTAAPTHRHCSIQITNKSCHYTLRYVGVHLVSGFCARPLPLKIKPGYCYCSSGSALFSKTAGAARGAAAVFSYDLYNKSTGRSDGRIAVMFSVPFDFNLYSSWYAVGVFDKSTTCDSDLYNQMYNSTGHMFTRAAAGHRLDHDSDQVSITALMTISSQTILSLQVRDS